jgi:hypothetical protein
MSQQARNAGGAEDKEAAATVRARLALAEFIRAGVPVRDAIVEFNHSQKKVVSFRGERGGTDEQPRARAL